MKFKSLVIISSIFILMGCATAKSETPENPGAGQSQAAPAKQEQAPAQEAGKEIPKLRETKRTIRFSDGKIDEYTVSAYTAEGLLQGETVYSASGSVLGTTEYVYKNNLLTQKTVRNELKEIRSRVVYEYDGKGLLTKETINDKDGKPLSAYAYSYDASGSLVSREFSAAGVKLAVTAYTYKGKLLSAGETKNDAGEKISSFENTYDKDNNLVTQKVFSGTGSIVQTITSVWKNGLEVSREQANDKGAAVRRETMEYGSSKELIKKSIEDIQGKSKQSIEYEYAAETK